MGDIAPIPVAAINDLHRVSVPGNDTCVAGLAAAEGIKDSFVDVNAALVNARDRRSA
jgi:hypothetical protein